MAVRNRGLKLRIRPANEFFVALPDLLSILTRCAFWWDSDMVEEGNWWILASIAAHQRLLPKVPYVPKILG